MMKTSGLWPMRGAGTLIGLALLGGGGCASVANKSTSGTGRVTNESSARGGSAEIAVAAGQPSKAPERTISSDDKQDFEKALANYHNLRKDGGLKGGACKDAAKAFRRAADQNPQLLEARHNEATVLYECGEREDARAIWEKLAKGDKAYAPAVGSLGLFAYQRGDVSEAEALFTRAIAMDQKEGSVASRINLAQIQRDKARRASSSEQKKQLNQEAIRNLRTVLAIDGNNLLAYATLCYLYYDLGLAEGAKLLAGQAIKRAEEIATGKFEDDPAASESFAAEDKASKKTKGKKDEPAVAKGRRLTMVGTGWTNEMKKHIALVHNTLGLIALNKKSVTEAIASFKKAVDLDPELSEARLNLAALALKFRDYGTAEQNLRAVLTAQPKNYEAMLGLGVALRGNRKFDEAEEQYLAAQKLEPQRPESYFNLGLLYQEYKAGSDKPGLQKAQQYYREFLGRADGSSGGLKKDAQKRIKDIDELFVALEEAAKLQREAEDMQRKAEEQQKKMEEQMKKQEADEKKGAAPTSPPAAGATGAQSGAAGGGAASP